MSEKASVLSWRGSDKYYNPYIGRGEVLFTGKMSAKFKEKENHFGIEETFFSRCWNAGFELFISTQVFELASLFASILKGIKVEEKSKIKYPS